MTDEAIRKLFAKIDEIHKTLNENTAAIAEMKSVVNRAAANSEVFVNGYHEHGAMIAALQKTMDKIMAVCPRMRPKTDEFKKVEE